MPHVWMKMLAAEHKLQLRMIQCTSSFSVAVFFFPGIQRDKEKVCLPLSATLQKQNNEICCNICCNVCGNFPPWEPYKNFGKPLQNCISKKKSLLDSWIKSFCHWLILWPHGGRVVALRDQWGPKTCPRKDTKRANNLLDVLTADKSHLQRESAL